MTVTTTFSHDCTWTLTVFSGAPWYVPAALLVADVLANSHLHVQCTHSKKSFHFYQIKSLNSSAVTAVTFSPGLTLLQAASSKLKWWQQRGLSVINWKQTKPTAGGHLYSNGLSHRLHDPLSSVCHSCGVRPQLSPRCCGLKPGRFSLSADTLNLTFVGYVTATVQLDFLKQIISRCGDWVNVKNTNALEGKPWRWQVMSVSIIRNRKSHMDAKTRPVGARSDTSTSRALSVHEERPAAP